MHSEKQIRILLAEDNEFNQELIVDLLSEAGFLVLAANNGLEVLHLLEQHTPDFFQLILMDLEMPLMDGYQATLKIRQSTLYPTMPIIALTAHEEAGTRDRCLTNGMQDYLIKPFDPEELNRSIHHWLNQAPNPPTAKTIVATSELPLQFKHLDTRTGLRSVANNQALLLQLLRRFASSQKDSLEQIKKAQLTGIFDEDFQRLIHTLKGIGATIGAFPIARLCLQIEATQDPGSHLEQLANELQLILEELDDFFAAKRLDTTTSESIISIDTRPLDEICKTLAELLQDSNPEAVNYFARNQSQFLSLFNHHDFTKFQYAIENYDFDQANTLLNTI